VSDDEDQPNTAAEAILLTQRDTVELITSWATTWAADQRFHNVNGQDALREFAAFLQGLLAAEKEEDGVAEQPVPEPEERSGTDVKRDWMALSRKEREKLREENRKHVEKDKAARQLPGSNLPPISEAAVADARQRTRDAITRAMQTNYPGFVAHPWMMRITREVLVSRRAYQAGGNTVVTALWALRAVIHPVESPGSPVREVDGLAHVHRLLAALDDAVAGKTKTFLDLLPKQENPKGGNPELPSTSNLRATAAASVYGLSVGRTQRGGVSQKKASELVEKAFEAAGITISAESALTYFKGIRRDNAEARNLYDRLAADARQKMAAGWPLAERKAWLKQLADGLGSFLGT
jgi:hypothetical protein